LQAAQAALPPLPDRASLEKLAAGLPALWHAPTTTARDRKRLLRTLIADVTLLPEADRGKARIGIRWQTGAVAMAGAQQGESDRRDAMSPLGGQATSAGVTLSEASPAELASSGISRGALVPSAPPQQEAV
jgi:hypothetical protein